MLGLDLGDVSWRSRAILILRETIVMPALSAEQQAEIEAQRAQSAPTRRATVPALEEVLYQALPVLDHGCVRVDRRTMHSSRRASS